MIVGIYKRGRVFWLSFAGPDGALVRESARTPERSVAERAHAIRKQQVASGTFDPSVPVSREPRAPRNVYFVLDQVTDAVKIGATFNVAKRLATLRACSPVPLTLLGVIRGGGLELETRLHQHFARDRLHGEWFRMSKEIAELISNRASLCSLDTDAINSGPTSHEGGLAFVHREITPAMHAGPRRNP